MTEFNYTSTHTQRERETTHLLHVVVSDALDVEAEMLQRNAQHLWRLVVEGARERRGAEGVGW